MRYQEINQEEKKEELLAGYEIIRQIKNYRFLLKAEKMGLIRYFKDNK